MTDEDFDLDELLKRAQEIFESREPELVPVVLGGRSAGIRYLPLSSKDWRELTLKHPPRPDVRQDINLGYNIDSLASSYPDVVLIKSSGVIDDMIREDAEGNKRSIWPDVYSALSKTGMADLAASMWAIHERDTERLVDDAGKASPASRKKKRS